MAPRFPILFALLLATGCGRPVPAPTRQAPAQPSVAEDRVACARGDEPLAPRCTVEVAGADRRTLVVRWPDSGFRRLAIVSDGRGVVAADGAEPARVRVVDARQIEVAVGGDRVRLPASMTGATR